MSDLMGVFEPGKGVFFEFVIPGFHPYIFLAVMWNHTLPR